MFFRFPLTFCHVIPWNFLGQPRHFFRFPPAFFRFLRFLLGIFQVSLHQLFITLSPEFCQIFPGIFVTIPQHSFFRSPTGIFSGLPDNSPVNIYTLGWRGRGTTRLSSLHSIKTQAPQGFLRLIFSVRRFFTYILIRVCHHGNQHVHE